MPSTDDLHGLRVESQDLGNGDLTLTADRGESLEILGRELGGANDEDTIVERVDEVAMLTYLGGENRETLFQNETLTLMGQDVINRMAAMGFDIPTTKVPAGTDYTVSNLDNGGTMQVIYRDFNNERWSRTDPGGPDSNRRLFITTGQEEVTISQNSQEANDIETSENAGGINNWPWEEDVPQNREYDVYGIAVRGEEDPAGSGSFSLDDFRLTSEEQDFMARSSAFISDAFAFYPDADPMTRQPFMFMNPHTGEPDPITFTPGDDLTVTLRGTETTDNDSVEASLIASLICRERRV